MEPKDRIRVYVDLLQYGLLKLQSVNVEPEELLMRNPEVYIVYDKSRSEKKSMQIHSYLQTLIAEKTWELCRVRGTKEL